MQGAPYIIVLLIFLATITTLSIISFVKINSRIGYESDIVQNWQVGALMDIAVAEKCPADFPEAINYTWPGITNGCFCGNASSFLRAVFEATRNITRSYCNANETIAGCKNIPSVAPYTLDKWGVIDGKRIKICLKRSQDTWAYSAPQSDKRCANIRMTRCGAKSDNFFCTNEPKCPISDIKIEKVDLTSDASAVSSCAYENGCLVLSNDGVQAKLIKFQRGDTFDALPVSEFRINEYGMCRLTDADYNTPGRPELDLLNKPKTSCEDGTNLWNLTDSMTEKEFFDLNGLTPIVSNLQKYGFYTPDTYNYPWSLFSRNYIPWKIKCRDQMEAVINQKDSLSKLKTLQLVFMIITIIMCAFALLILLNYTCIQSYRNRELDPVFIRLSNYFWKSIQLVFQILVLIASSNNKQFFKKVLSQACSTPAISELLDSLENSIKVAHNNNIAGLVIISLVLVFDTVYFYYQLYKQRLTSTRHYLIEPGEQSLEFASRRNNY